MGLLSRLRPAPVEPATGNATQNAAEIVVPRRASNVALEGGKGEYGTQVARERDIDSDSDDEVVHKNAQWGVQKAEAMCQAWGKKSLYATYIL
jgi:hypothetical protein